MTDIEVITNLFESHLLTVSTILGIVSFLFGVLGVFSFIQVRKYITSKVENAVKGNIKSLIENEKIEEMIKEEVNGQIKRYGLVVKDLVDNTKGDKIKEGDL